MQNLKKFLLSFFVIFTFVGYAVIQKVHGSSEEGNVIPPVSLISPSPVASTKPESSAGIVQSNTPVPTSVSTSAPVPTPIARGQYKDGSYTGDSVDAYYGNVQVKAIITNGKITDVQFLDYPHDRNTSIRINSQAMPYLTTEAIQAQNANVDTISGATATSGGFRASLQSALNKAK